MPPSSSDFVGEWRQIEPDPSPQSIFITFEADGRLRYTVEDETIQHIVVMWHVDGDALVTDQPSAPRRERTSFRFLSPSRVILERSGESYIYGRL